ncbi:MAG: HAD-IA family hydrolase [Acidimicrobiia bacterium]|nr:HAD-IA family hydrolase [Acidimicrobiia bacterium]
MAPDDRPQSCSSPGTSDRGAGGIGAVASERPAGSSTSARPAVRVISLDVGGVLVLPHTALVGRALDRAGVAHDHEDLRRVHYLSMAAVDAARSAPEDFTDYLDGLLDAVDASGAARDRARTLLDDLFGSPVWCQPVPGARRGLARLVELGVPLAVTSNSDGSVARILADFEIAQVGPGPGVELVTVVDSGAVGVAKPDPAIFAITAERCGVMPAEVLHVGDSVHYDVDGATAAGALAVHFDPFGLRPDDGHLRVASLEALEQFLTVGGPPVSEATAAVEPAGLARQFPAERYRRAEQFCEWNVRPLVRNVTVTPQWTGDGDEFWYERQLPGGRTEVVSVDPDAATATVVSGPPGVPSPPSTDRNVAPDGSAAVLVVDGNLVVEDSTTGRRQVVTDDAEVGCAYAASPQSSTTWVSARRADLPSPPVGVWSPDGRRFLTHRLDERAVPETPLVEMRPDEGHRPRLWTYRMPFLGDELATAQLVVVDLDGEAPTVHEVGDPLLVEFVSPLELGWVWWSADSDEVWFLREARGATALTLCRAVPGGAVREVITEAADDYVEPHPLLPWPSSVKVGVDGATVVWPSERDGHRHLYLLDADTGEVLRQLTSGDWTVRDVLGLDGEWIWCTGCGREPRRDPYFRHLYRVPLASGEPELLTPEDADHTPQLSPSGRFVLDTCSTVATAPVTRLRRSDGTLVLDLEEADLSELAALGWRPPERFCVTGADGVTEVHGVLYLPSDFDPQRRYPVVDSWYPGPQLIRTPKSFTVDDDAGVDAWPGPWGAQAMAELGLVVVNVDGRGTPLRSRAFHHATYGNLSDHAIADHLAAVDALAADRPWMDVARLGAQGHSAGAAATVRAMLVRPDRYRVGIAGSAVNDLRRYMAYWGEKYQGMLGTFDADEQSNLSLVDRLEGHLLLLHGELDDNVHPSNTFALYDAFVRAGRDVELVVLAGEAHPCWRHPYYVRRSWDTVVRHLLDLEPPAGYQVSPPPAAATGPGW